MFQNLPDSAKPIVVSYIGVRRAIGVSGMLLPVLLGPVGWLVFGIEIQENMSSYYHTPMRDIFVGTLCAIGVFLFCYQGHDWIENWTANLACVFAIGIALLPLDENSDPLNQSSLVGYLHSFCGGVFFLILSFYSLFHFPSSKAKKLEQEPHEKQRDFVYRVTGVVILASVLTMGSFLLFFSPEWKKLGNQYNIIFWLEWIAVWAFAVAWLTKGRVILADFAIELLAFTQAKLLGEESETNASQKQNDNRTKGDP